MKLQGLPQNLSEIGESLEGQSPQYILRWAVDTYGSKLTMATAFGAEGCILLAMLAEIAPDIHAFNLETGYQFRETLELRERIKHRYDIEVHYVRPEETVEQMEARFGGPIYRTRPDECCRIRKIEPLKRAVAGFDAWISAIRRDQTSDRAQSGIVEWDNKFQLVKVNPLANWTKQDVWDYIEANDVPYNPLHKEGYPSIGCWPCTRPVDTEAGELHDRSGRWSGLVKVECGLHSR
jgi:phosphoadenosine phosphosulfate reductase